jgi:hypothetical protein
MTSLKSENLVTPKAVPKHELLFNILASDAGLQNTNVSKWDQNHYFDIWKSGHT